MGMNVNTKTFFGSIPIYLRLRNKARFNKILTKMRKLLRMGDLLLDVFSLIKKTNWKSGFYLTNCLTLPNVYYFVFILISDENNELGYFTI